jgi:adenosylcobinamide-phosphate synthase
MQSLDLTHVMRADSALVMLMALALEAALPQSWVWQRLPHPVAIFGSLVDHADRKLNRDTRSFRARMARGAVVAVGLTAIAFGAGVLLDSLFRSIPHGWIGEAAVIIVMLAQRSLFEHVQRVERRLAAGYLNSARVAVGKIVGRDVNVLDEHGVSRAAIESLTENFSDAVVSPMFWYLVLGLPGLLAFKAISTMDSMIGHLTPRYAAFGRVAARLDDAANFIPARLSAILLAIAALCIPGGRPLGAIRTALRDGHRHRSVNAGFPEAAAAGALGLALGGPRSYGGETIVEPWLNDGGASATVTDIRRALILYVVACLANAMVVAGVLYLTL